MFPHRVDLVLTGGQIWTGAGHSQLTEPTSIAIRDGRVVATGSDDELAPLAADAETVIELAGRRLIPGLNDTHIHAVRAGATWDLCLHWEGLRSLEDGLAQIRSRASAAASGEWISVVGGWHSRQLREARLPSRAELDAAAPDNPVFVQELYDNGVMNSAALAVCGLDSASADPLNGRLARDVEGRLTGDVVGLGAFALPLAFALNVAPPQAYEGTRHMFDEFARHGLTGVIDGGGLMIAPRDYRPIHDLWARGELTVRTRMFVSAWTRGGEVENARSLVEFVHPGFGDGMLQVAGLGEIPHLGCHDMEGLDPFILENEAYDELVEIVRVCAAAGWRMSVHAVLNDTLSRILDAWETVEREMGGVRGRRFSIVHADAASERNIERIAALGAGVMVQNRLMLKATDYARGWGSESVTSAPPIGAMRKHGIVIGGGTDATRANWFSPWASIGWLVAGAAVDGAAVRGPEHMMSISEALQSYTSDAAWFTAEESHRGRLEPGFDADFCVPSLDPFACRAEELAEVRSDLTGVGGVITHASGAFAGAATR